MRIKNYEIENLQGFLMSFELGGKDSRLRTRFVRTLNEYVNRMYEERDDLIKSNCHLDEDGEPKFTYIGEDRKKYDIKDLKKFDKEYSELLHEEVIVEVTEERKEMFKLIKRLILECEFTFKGEEAFKYDRFCEIVEQLELE